MTNPHSDTIELGQAARAIGHGWRALAGFTALGVLTAAAVILFAPRRYTGTATVVIKSGGGGGGSSILSQVSGLGDITAGLLGGKSPLETEVEVMSSQSMIGRVVDSLFLQAKIIGETTLAATNALTDLSAPGAFSPRTYHFERVGAGRTYRYRSDDESGEMTPGMPLRLPAGTVTFTAATPLPKSFELRLMDRQDAVKRVERMLKVGKEKGEVASIVYKGDDSVTAALVPNTLLEIYLARRRGADRGINQRRVEFLTAKNDSMEAALAVAGRSLRQQQEQSGVLDAEAVARVELESGAELRSKLTDILVEQGALNQLIEQIESRSVSPRELAAYPKFLGSPVINNLVGQLSDFETRKTMLLATREETDRDVVALTKSAEAVEARLLPYARTYAKSLDKERRDIETSLAQIDRKLARLPRAAESSSQLQRDVVDLARLSAVLQAQIVEAKLAAIGEGGDVRPLDLATIPKRPSFPDPMVTAGIGTFGGLFLGVFAAFLVGSAGRWMRDPIEVERSTGVPALQFDPAVPLLLSNSQSRTIIVAPIEAGVPVAEVVNRLTHTALSRSLSAVVLDLPATAPDVNGSIARLESEHDLVIVQLPSLVSDTAAAALQHTRPVFLVANGRRIERRRLLGAVQMLRRLEIPVAGIVMSNGKNGERAITG